jgi:hypothetical protein
MSGDSKSESRFTFSFSLSLTWVITLAVLLVILSGVGKYLIFRDGAGKPPPGARTERISPTVN